MNGEKPLTWEYIAGFFDGEGTICFANYKYRKGESRYITIAISQAESQAKIIYEIKDFLQREKIRCRLSRDKTGKQKQYQIRLNISGMGNARELACRRR